MESPKSRVWRGIAGALAGLVIGGIAAVNVEISSGAVQGYQTSPGDFLRQHPVAAVFAAMLLVVGCVVGAWLGARRSR